MGNFGIFYCNENLPLGALNSIISSLLTTAAIFSGFRKSEGFEPDLRINFQSGGFSFLEKNIKCSFNHGVWTWVELLWQSWWGKNALVDGFHMKIGSFSVDKP